MEDMEKTRQQSEEEVATVKRDYQRKVDSLSGRETRAAQKEKELRLRADDLNREVQVRAEEMIERKTAELEWKYRNAAKELSQIYADKSVKYAGAIWILLLYGIIVTIWLMACQL